MKGERINNGGTEIYMAPLTLKAWKRRKRIPVELEIMEDAFSFGLSILEMGNLLSLKNIRLNQEKKLLDQ